MVEQIHCLMVGKDRAIEELRVDPSRSTFSHNRGLYTIPREAVNIAKFTDPEDNKGRKKGNSKIKPYPELIYVEGNPQPVNLQNYDVQAFLDHIVLSNALQQVAAPRSDWAIVFLDYVKHPSKALLGLFVLIIAGAVIGGLLF